MAHDVTEGIFAVLYVMQLCALHVVIKRQFFALIFAVFLLNLKDI